LKKNRWFVSLFALFIHSYTFAQAPVTEFTVSVNGGCSPLLVSFTDLSTGNPTSWLWDFGNGNTSTFQNPSVIYVNPAAYSVTLTTSNGSGSDSVTKTAYITVYNDPVVNFTVDTSIGCVPLTVNFTDVSVPGSGSINTRYWDFGDGNTSILPNPSHTYNIPGSFSVFLFVENTNGCKDQLLQSSYISAYMPVAGFNITSAICHPPFVVDFNNSSQGTALTYNWDFGDGDTSTLENPTHNYITADTFEVKLLITDVIGCVDSAIQSMNFVDFTADFDYSVLCTDSDFTVSFTDMSAPSAMNWLWDLDDGDTSILQNPTHTYDSIVPQTITLVATLDPGCTDTVSKTYIPPSAQFTLDTNYSCESPFQIIFTNLSTGTDSLSFQWDLGDSTTSSDTNVTHTYTVPQGTYIDSFFVSLVVTNRFGCTDTVRDTITVNKPEAKFTALPPEGCIPLTVSFGDSSISDTTVTGWIWDFGDGNTSTAQHPTNIYVDTGHYTVTLIITNALGCQDSLTKVDFVKAGIMPDFVDFIMVLDTNTMLQGDTICHHRFMFFFDSSGFNDTSIKVNNWCWKFHYNNSFMQWVYGVDEPTYFAYTDSCYYLGPFDQHNPMTHIQNPYHDYDELYVGYNQQVLGGDTLWVSGQHINMFGSDTIRLVVGYNGCNDTIIKTIFILPPTAYPGFVFPDSIKLAACSSPETFGFFNGSIQWDTLLYYYIIHLQTGDTIHDFVVDGYDTTLTQFIEDTTVKSVPYKSITFTKAGNYGITISVKNDSTGCVDRRYRELTIDSVVNGFTIAPNVCLDNNSFTFNDTSVSYFGFVSAWFWTFGDGDTLKGKRTDTIYPDDGHEGRTTGSYDIPKHVYMDTGTYVVKSIITVKVPYKLRGAAVVDYLKCFYESIDTIRVHKVYPDFAADTTTGCPVFTVNFSDSSSSTASILSWNWNFGDGDTSNLQNPIHSYTDTGIYNVTLIVEDNTGCIDTLLKVDHIKIITPIADFIANPVKICLGDFVFIATDTAYFSSLSIGDSLSFLWDFGDGNFDTIANPKHTYNDTGTYTVGLWITDKSGCTDSLIRNDYITVFNPPAGGFTLDMLTEDCTPIIVSFNDTSSANVVSWYWSFGDGQNSAEQNPTHIYANSGIYQVSLFVTDSNGCTALVIQPGLINTQAPTGSFVFSPDSGCVPLDVSFFSNAQYTDFYFWDFGDGSPFGLDDSLVHTYNQTGTFTPSLILADSNGCSFTTLPNGFVYIEDLLPGFSVSDTVLCDIDSIYFTDTTFFVSAINWHWDFGDGDTSTVQHPVHLYDTTGLYEVTLTVTSSECTLTVVKPNYISINALPAVSVLVSDTVECIPFTAQFSANISANTSSINSLEWDFGDGSPIDTAQSPAHLYVAAGSYNVTLKVVYGPGNCEFTDSSNYIVAYDPPVAAFEASTTDPTCFSNTTFLFDNSSVNGNSYSWNFGDGNTSAEQYPAHTFADTGYYIVQLITSNQINCADSAVITLYAFDYKDIISIPNVFTPNDDGINDVFYIGGSDLVQVEGVIFNRWGEKIYSWNDQDKLWNGRTLNNLPIEEGVYYYILTICNDEKMAGFVHMLR